ncbi:unnamed protein product [Tilletia caries]|nr:unnamed protein product [Tilletia caries]
MSGATIRRDLAVFHGNLELDMKKRLQGIDTLFSVQHDAWTTKGFQYSFVAMLATYVDRYWEFSETLLSFDVLKEKHTGATFSGHLARTLLANDLGDKWAGSVTSDSTGTNHRMMDVLDSVDYESSGEEDMGPEAGELLSDDGGGPEVDGPSKTRISKTKVNAVTKLEAFTTSIHRGSGRRDDFRTTMAKEYHRRPKLAKAPFPPKPNATRWSSHFRMIRAALKIREAIDSHCRANIGKKSDKLGSYLLTKSEWTMLEFLMPILELASEATKELEKARGTLYMVLDHHASLRDKIKATVAELDTADLGKETTESLKSFLAAMSSKLLKYRTLALHNRYTLVAALLDPANRMELFELAYPTYGKEAEKALRDIMSEWLGQGQGNNQLASTASTSNGAGTSTTMLQEAKRLRQQQLAEERRKKTDTDSDEVARYLNIKNCPWRDSDETPYKWWRDNENVFPNIAKIARVILGIPGSSSSVERVFSQAALFSTSKRQSLSSKALSKLVSTKHWLIHGADELSGLPAEVKQIAETINKLPDL